MTNKKTTWARIWEGLTRRFVHEHAGRQMPELPPADPDANSKLLLRLREDDPVYVTFLQHAQSRIETEMGTVLDYTKPAAERLSCADRAAGVLALVDVIEGVRDKWREHLRRERASRRKQEHR